MSDADAKFLVEAVTFVADHGWKFLSQYRCNFKDGTWSHIAGEPRHQRLRDISFASGSLEYPCDKEILEALPQDQVLDEAHRIVETIEKQFANAATPTSTPPRIADLMFPEEAMALLSGQELPEANQTEICDTTKAKRGFIGSIFKRRPKKEQQ